jgi:oxygen-independent coproporphyrinogen-3 oxidase
MRMSVFSLYVHIPYCEAKCPYCDFNSYAAEYWPEARYVAALCAELEHYARKEPWRGGELDTIFFGGGTPSLFAPGSIAAVLQTAQRLWPCKTGAEITLEANPGTVDIDKLRGIRAAGVNRLSFGVQSFHPSHLHRLGRIHNADEALAAVGTARQAGFDNVSIDLIFALPQQTLAEWERDLVQACALHPNHISAYNLTYADGTPFHELRAQGVLRELPEDIELAMFTRTREILAAHGYAQYEISNYARPGYACRHNLNYWHGGLYLGVGAGAHSYARPASRESGSRWSNEQVPGAYMTAVEQHGHAGRAVEELTARQARGEFVFLGLRCLDGFAAADFYARFGADLPVVFPHVTALCSDGLLRCNDGRWKLTARGMLLADSVFATFL